MMCEFNDDSDYKGHHCYQCVKVGLVYLMMYLFFTDPLRFGVRQLIWCERSATNLHMSGNGGTGHDK